MYVNSMRTDYLHSYLILKHSHRTVQLWLDNCNKGNGIHGKKDR